MNDLKGKVAIVFGASRGIGKHTAARLAATGGAVVVAGRDLVACEVIATDACRLGAKAIAAKVDVMDYGSVAAAVDLAVSQFGGLDIVVNNAGVIEPIQLIAECDVLSWKRSIEINVLGVLHGCRAALPRMLEQGRGVIVNVSSGAASNPHEGWSAYSAGKAGVAMLTRSLHLEYSAQGLRVFGLRPGLVDTAMQSAIRQSGVNEISRTPQSSLSHPSVPASAIAWLCTDAAADLTGDELDIRDPDLRRRMGL